eukprot:2661793-Pleurochrysis_carterae.AAC.1
MREEGGGAERVRRQGGTCRECRHANMHRSIARPPKQDMGERERAGCIGAHLFVRIAACELRLLVPLPIAAVAASRMRCSLFTHAQPRA